MLHQYYKKYKTWQKKRDPMTDFKSDLDISRYTLLIKNIPRKKPVRELQMQMT